jgi:hypothetical protein
MAAANNQDTREQHFTILGRGFVEGGVLSAHVNISGRLAEKSYSSFLKTMDH